MILLSNGFKLPEDLDSGAEFFPALEDNIQRMNDHTHDGTNSERLTAASGVVVTQSLLAVNWVLVGVGNYRQLVTLDSPLLFDEIAIEMRLSTGEVIHPTIEKVTANTFYVYVNDNTLALTAVYST